VSDFYTCSIYNQRSSQKGVPIYAFLSREENFGLEQVKIRLRQGSVRHFIVVANGQQLPTLEQNDESDRVFGRKLTGIHRLRGRSNWQVDYQIYTSQSRFPSVASQLADRLGDKAVVLDILDAKFNWEDSVAENETALAIVRGLITEIAQTSANPPALVMAGFSRGAVLVLRLAEQLRTVCPVLAVATMDPVIAPWKEETQLCKGWGVRDKGAWKILWQKKLPGAHLALDYFPILKNPGVPCHNVFQRRALFALNQVWDKPIGSAVESAMAPGPESGWKPAGSDPHCAQYDESVDCHSQMVDKYSDWVLELVGNYCNR
jgi:hypothetical protein